MNMQSNARRRMLRQRRLATQVAARYRRHSCSCGKHDMREKSAWDALAPVERERVQWLLSLSAVQ